MTAFVDQKSLGRRGEAIAALYLRQKGYRILSRNWSVRGRNGKLLGELDIVARKGRDIVFVEVKAGMAPRTRAEHGSGQPGTVPRTRAEHGSGQPGTVSAASDSGAWSPEMHMTPWKAERIRRAARAWLVQHRLLDAPWQIDLIAIDVPASGLPRVRHYRKVMSD